MFCDCNCRLVVVYVAARDRKNRASLSCGAGRVAMMESAQAMMTFGPNLDCVTGDCGLRWDDEQRFFRTK